MPVVELGDYESVVTGTLGDKDALRGAVVSSSWDVFISHSIG